MEGARQKVFENGFTFLHQPSPLRHSKTTCIQLFVQAGSILETTGLRGACHLIEHMCFKGTPTFKDTESLFRVFQMNGASVNAYTEKRLTCYTMECPESNIADCLLTLSDMLMNSTFPPKDYEKELHVVLEENVKNMDDDAVQINNLLMHEVFFGTPYMYPVDDISYHRGNGTFSTKVPSDSVRPKNGGGKSQQTVRTRARTRTRQGLTRKKTAKASAASTNDSLAISSISPTSSTSSTSLLPYDRVRALYGALYVPRNMVLSVVTSASYDHCHRILMRSHWIQNVERSVVMRIREEPLTKTMLNAEFSNSAREVAMQPLSTPSRSPMYYVFKRSKELNTAHYILAYQVGSIYDTHEADLLRFLAEYIGNPTGGKLPMLLREKYGLTYTSSCELELYETRGVFYIYAETEPKRMFSSTKHGRQPGVANIILNFVRRLGEDGVDETDVRRVKEFWRSKHELDSEDNDTLCGFHGYRCIMRLPPENYADYFQNHVADAVTIPDVNALCRKLFLQSPPFQVYYGNGVGVSNRIRTRVVRKIPSAPITNHPPLLPLLPPSPPR